MPVRNALPYLDASIESILGQTHPDFEFVIGDDGSTDGSTQVLREWAARDSRIHLIEGRLGRGPSGSSNWVVRNASGELIARMDADDVAHPERLARQLDVFMKNPDAVLVASLWEGIDRRGRRVREPDPSKLASGSFGSPIAHGSVMMRREAFDKVGGYRPECDFWEDLDLYLRLARIGKILVLPETLYSYRFADTSSRLTANRHKVEKAIDLMIRCRDWSSRGGDYNSLLRSQSQAGKSHKFEPETFLSIASIDLWSGYRPRIAGRFLRHGLLAFNRRTLKSLIWLILADAHPRSFRFVLNQLSKWRARSAGGPVAGIYEWIPMRACAVSSPASPIGSDSH